MPVRIRPLLLTVLLVLGSATAHAAIDCGDLGESQCNDLRATEKRNQSLKSEERAKQAAKEAESLARCVLDKVPDALTDSAADSAYKNCLPGHPVNYADAPPRSGGMTDFIFGYGSGASCTAKEGGKTSSPRARTMIKRACEYLYGK